MPLWRPPRNREYRLATGGTGLEGQPPPPGIQFETSLGSSAFLESQGAISENEVFRISHGEQALHVIPQGERVILTGVASAVSGGLVEFEQEAIDLGRGVLDVVQDPLAAANAAFAEEALLNLALSQGLESGELTMLPDGTIIVTPPSPVEETAPPPDFGGGASTDQPIVNPGGSTSGEDAPTGGCETSVTDPQFGPSGEVLDPGGIIHFDGSQ